MTISVSPTEEKTEIFGLPLDNLPHYSVKPKVGSKPTEIHDGVNHQLLDEILSYIKAHPLTWRQESWFKIVDKETGKVRYDSEEVIVEEVNSCGAAFCFAGHVAIREGFPAPPLDNHSTWYRVIDDPHSAYPRREEASEFAMKRLGISDGVADVLFSAENSLEDIQDIVEALHLAPTAPSYVFEELGDRRYAEPENFDSNERISVRQYLLEEGFLEPEVATV